MIRSPGKVRFWRSPALAGALFFGISGLGFAAGSLLLARVLSKTDLGILMLAIALIGLGYQLAPLGSDGVINRRQVDFGVPLLWRMVGTSTLAGLVFFLVSHLAYHLGGPISLLVSIGVVAGGLNLVAAAKFQSLQQFLISLTLSNSLNLTIVLVSILALVFHAEALWIPLSLIVLGYIVSASAGWYAILRMRRSDSGPFEPFDWGEALSYAGVHLAAVVLTQLERLLIPGLLSLEELATFAVLAAVTIAPFRMLQLGVGYTLLPRMRAASSVEERRRLLFQELLMTGSVVVIGVAAVWMFAPLVAWLFLGDKYILSPALIGAALVSGTVRVLTGFTRATASALCSNRELAYLSGLMWLSIACAIAGAAFGSRWGLVGLIYGAAIGWIGQLAVSASVAVRHFRTGSGAEDGDRPSA
jgi:O-antigen/teichoic acid export membrane protein